MQKTQKGITLIALIITIIILLILAGISIASLTQTGLFGKAQDAKTKDAIAREKEQIKIAIMTELTENYTKITVEGLKEQLIKYKDVETVEGTKTLPSGATLVSRANKKIKLEDLFFSTSYAADETGDDSVYAKVTYKSGRVYYVKLKDGDMGKIYEDPKNKVDDGDNTGEGTGSGNSTGSGSGESSGSGEDTGNGSEEGSGSGDNSGSGTEGGSGSGDSSGSGSEGGSGSGEGTGSGTGGTETGEDTGPWIIDEESGEITEKEPTTEAKTLKVGDYVNYQEKVTEVTDTQLETLNTTLNTYSGNKTNKIVNETLSWRILDVTENGKLRLISAKPTTNTINLHGANGYNNAVNLIDDTCKTLYNSTYANNVQNLKIEDVEKYMVTKPTLKDTIYSPTYYDYCPSILAQEANQSINGATTGSLGMSEPVETLIKSEDETKTVTSVWKLKETFYSQSMSDTSFTKPMYYTLFINNGTKNYSKYWLSSRCVRVDIYSASFRVRSVYDGEVNANPLARSDILADFYCCGFRPVITLNSNVTIGTGDGSLEAPYKLN